MLVGCFLSGTIKAQEMVGGTEEQLRKLFPDYYFNYMNLPDGSRTIGITCLLGAFSYHFDRNNIIDICLLIPYEDALNDVIQFNNKNYTKISDTRWKKYRLGKIILIDLVYERRDNAYTFYYKESKN